MEGRVEETNRGRVALQRLEDPEEIRALVGEEFRERGLAVGQVASEDHLAHGVDTIAFEEHVLSPGEADAHGAECDRLRGLFGGVGIGADLSLVAFSHHFMSWT